MNVAKFGLFVFLLGVIFLGLGAYYDSMHNQLTSDRTALALAKSCLAARIADSESPTRQESPETKELCEKSGRRYEWTQVELGEIAWYPKAGYIAGGITAFLGIALMLSATKRRVVETDAQAT